MNNNIDSISRRHQIRSNNNNTGYVARNKWHKTTSVHKNPSNAISGTKRSLPTYQIENMLQLYFLQWEDNNTYQCQKRIRHFQVDREIDTSTTSKQKWVQHSQLQYTVAKDRWQYATNSFILVVIILSICKSSFRGRFCERQQKCEQITRLGCLLAIFCFQWPRHLNERSHDHGMILHVLSWHFLKRKSPNQLSLAYNTHKSQPEHDFIVMNSYKLWRMREGV